MSDPVTNAEVEDVLSSIRRLVSEDKRPLQGRPPEPAAPETDRLVLTPSLRVADDPEPETVEDDADLSAEAEAEQEVEAEADVAEDMQDPPQEPAPDLDDLLDDGSDDFFVEEKTGEISADGTSHVDELAEDYSDDPYNFDQDEDATTAKADVQDVELAETVTEAEPEGPSDEDILASLSLELADRADETDLLADDDGVDDRDEDADPNSPAVLAADISKEASLSAKIEALETAIGKIPDRWEPDGQGSDDYAGTDAASIAWEEEVQRDATGAPVGDVTEDEETALTPDAEEKEEAEEVEAAEPENAELAEASDDETPTLEIPIPPRAVIEATHAARSQDYPESQAPALADRLGDEGDEQLLDEEALRDMVSEIVRAELQGALGERITRNVRKLVRREIHRALTAQDLE